MSSIFVPAGKSYSLNWIVNKRADLTWFIGGALAAYIIYFLYAGYQIDMVLLWFWWVVLLDTPHFFSTYLRTYFDKEEFQQRKGLLLWSLSWLFVGPAIIGLSYLMYLNGMSSYKIPFLFFVLAFNLWAYWHVVRQHYGIMSLYKRKNQDYSQIDDILDKSLLYVGLLAPFTAFILRHPEARQVVGLSGTLGVMPDIGSTGFFSLMTFEHWIILLTVIAFIVIVTGFVSRQIFLYAKGLQLNLPKILFFIALIPLYSMINYSDAMLTIPLLGFTVLVTIYHDLQYHAIVWFYSKNRYHKEGVDKQRFGMAPKITRNFFSYVVWAIGVAALMRFAGCTLEVHPGCGPIFSSAAHNMFGSFSTQEFLYSIFIGIPMHHYFVDQFIWRPSKDANLQNDLKLKKS